MIAIDGGDKVSFGEFKVFVNDSDHKTLTNMLQQNVAQQLERQGRKFQTWLYNIFWEEEASVNGNKHLIFIKKLPLKLISITIRWKSR
jgi:hypothetical protein